MTAFRIIIADEHIVCEGEERHANHERARSSPVRSELSIFSDGKLKGSRVIAVEIRNEANGLLRHFDVTISIGSERLR
jgi:hypothetical protein